MLGINLFNGSSGPDVTNLQLALIAKGFGLPIYGADGIFGDETEGAVKAFQASVGLPVTGVVDDNTWKKLVGSVPVVSEGNGNKLIDFISNKWPLIAGVVIVVAIASLVIFKESKPKNF